jgi:hypothetical protein
MVKASKKWNPKFFCFDFIKFLFIFQKQELVFKYQPPSPLHKPRFVS